MWIYEIDSGRISRAGALLAVGYSGAPGAVNDASKTNIPDVGPLPEGFYTLGTPIPMEQKVGAYAIPLIPDLENQMYGRSGFFMHGDNTKMNQSASKGCIVAPLFARERVGQGIADDNRLQAIKNLAGPEPEQWSVT